jgi:hypothetical protein
LARGSIIVEFRDGEAPRHAAAKGFHGLELLKEVVVQGRALKDEAGNVILVASGVHVQ